MFRVPWYIGWPVFIAAMFAVLHYLANRSLYYPMKHPAGLWTVQEELGAKDVRLDAEGGVQLHAWMIRRPESRLITIHLHGNAGNITHRYMAAREILAAGSSVLLVDYRGYGKSGGRPTESGLYADAQAAYDHVLRSGYRAEQIVIHGESLGTAVAVELASRRPCGGVVLEAAFTSARDVAGLVAPVVGPLLVRSFDSRARIGSVKAPILFVHGDRDTLIPLELGKALFSAAREPKTFWVVSGAGHNDIVDAAGSNYREQLRAFYAGLGR